MKDGLRHGTGTYKCATCPSTYIGEWVNGMRHGKGVLYFDRNCETYYDGDWKYGIKNGYGLIMQDMEKVANFFLFLKVIKDVNRLYFLSDWKSHSKKTQYRLCDKLINPERDY